MGTSIRQVENIPRQIRVGGVWLDCLSSSLVTKIAFAALIGDLLVGLSITADTPRERGSDPHTPYSLDWQFGKLAIWHLGK